MLRGVEAGESTFREAVLLQTLKYEEDLENLRTMLIYRSSILDRTNQEEVRQFNALIKEYEELKNPHLKKQREDLARTKADDLKSLRNLDLSKLNFKKSKVGDRISEFQESKEEGIIKII